MKKFLEEFKAFALRGNVFDMAIGVVIGGAFTSIVNSIVTDIFNPFISLIANTSNLDKLSFTLREATETSDAVILTYGNFINTVIQFVIIAFIIFMLIKAMNKLANLKKVEEEAQEEAIEETPANTLLLQEILTELKKNN
jgi:large conductance mechanosensitive channel